MVECVGPYILNMSVSELKLSESEKLLSKKKCIWETPNLLMCADSSTDT